jgi:cyclomaltodextrinase / maltogenic alpha-amylase / neopullulanase
MVMWLGALACAAEISHTFTYDATQKNPRPKTVNLAGDFNGWSTSDTPMADDGKGVFSVSLKIEEGVHPYKFVLNRDTWINDPKADKKLESDDGNGGMNSGVAIGVTAPVKPAENNPSGEFGQQFTFDARKIDPAPKSVNLAGDFNGWSTTATPMQGKDGLYTVRVPLSDGVHHYKFVINGENWLPDPNADKALEEDDGHGGKNSGVMAGTDSRKFPPPVKGAIYAPAIRHDSQSVADLDIVSPDLMKVTVRTQAEDVDSVAVLLRDSSGTWSRHLLYKTDTQNGFDRYSGLMHFSDKPVHYMFELADAGKTFYYVSGQLNSTRAEAEAVAYSSDGECTFVTPEWAKHAVWYQIFPERFRNGDPSNDPENTKRWQSKWFATLPGEAPGEENFYKGAGNVWKRRFGGDVQGLKQALPYLRSLGINAIYLNPMFEAESMHKYDTSDYRHIDEHFGVKGDIEQLVGETDDPATWQWTASDKIFLDFVAEAHRQGFKVILDGVFNHVGRDFWAFKDVMKNGRASKYAGWFDIRSWDPPIKYIAWDKGNTPTSDGALPVFKKSNETGLVDGPRQHILAITKRWLAPDGDATRGVDGFRLDVPGDVPHPFWVEWRKLVKTTKPDAYISGEIWDFAQAWLRGDQFDAVMNYRFAVASQKFFVNQQKATSPSQFSNDLNAIVNAYPFQVTLVLQNLFDSHDTDRFASMFVNPDRAYDASNRIQDNGPDYNPAKPTAQQYQRMRQAVACQMTFAGAPMIYYGDDNGMWGPDDPSDRQPMVWKDLEPYDDPDVKFDEKQFEFYQRAIAVHRALPALQTGYFHTIVMDDSAGTIAYSRDLDNSQVVVVLNRSGAKKTVKVPLESKVGKWVNYFDESAVTVANSSAQDVRPSVTVKTGAGNSVTNGTLSVTLEPYSSAVMAAAK